MIRYRPHRGLLAASLAAMVEVRDRRSLWNHINASPFGHELLNGTTPDSLIIEPYSGYDRRTGWEQTYVVKTGAMSGVLGFTDGSFDGANETIAQPWADTRLRA